MNADTILATAANSVAHIHDPLVRLATHAGQLQGEIRRLCAQLEAFEPPSEVRGYRLIDVTLPGSQASAVAEWCDGDDMVCAVYVGGSDILDDLSATSLARVEDQVLAHFEAQSRAAKEDMLATEWVCQ